MISMEGEKHLKAQIKLDILRNRNMAKKDKVPVI